jgi:hypothetical protein
MSGDRQPIAWESEMATLSGDANSGCSCWSKGHELSVRIAWAGHSSDRTSIREVSKGDPTSFKLRNLFTRQNLQFRAIFEGRTSGGSAQSESHDLEEWVVRPSFSYCNTQTGTGDREQHTLVPGMDPEFSHAVNCLKRPLGSVPLQFQRFNA